MRRTIETAPRDGNVIIVEDDARGTYDVVHWSAETGEWVGENGEPTKIAPSHWYPMPRENFLKQEQGLDVSTSPSRAGPPTSRARRYGFLPFSPRRTAPQRPTTKDVIAPRSVASATPTTVATVKAQATAAEAKRRPHARRGFATSPIAATLLAAAFIGMYFHAEVAAYAARYPGLQDIFKQEIQASRDWRKTNLSALQRRAEGDHASAQPVLEAAAVKQAVAASVPDAQQSLGKEQRAEALAKELAEARHTIDGLNLQLRTEAATSAQLLEREHGKAAALVQEATAARQELAASAGQHRHAVEEERARSVALASELAMARREIETNAALLNKARDDAAQFKQSGEKTTAELQKERDRAEASSRELAIARREIETNVALNKARDYAAQFKQAGENTAAELQQERDRAEASSRELAIARREIETNAALLNEARDDAAQFKQTSERVTAELQQEHDRVEALASELAKARREVETQAAQLRKADGEAAQLRQAAASATAELQQSLQQERNRAEAMARDLEATRRTLDGRAAPEHAANSQSAEVTPAAEATATVQPATTEPQGSPEAARLIARASALLGQENIGAARIVLERAAEMGSAQASFMLAETYDPIILSAWGTYGTRGEASKAREFYAKAQAGGIQEAKDRFSALR
ncbi:hypothetical protein SAMN05444159_4869 [Bradyrhizobium lablabi]|uniref:Uncharacterized protein n=1 Tax=Bradyrhizobium lablabi TaxID=722472 RepID=A0A1M6XH16_9BRAD|nr:hypothetical protein [Bradyrhizobium lablabi]SHL05236.1 hypothetical protein SAMN05444159_4869 [Bradyrhizobium lablabi]